MRAALSIAVASLLLGTLFTADRADAATRVMVTHERYGADPSQIVTVSRKASSDGKTVIFLHGGGWNGGGRSSLEAEAAGWAKTGWVVVNAAYRRGTTDGVPGDGRRMLEDALTVLTKYRAKSYVDPDRIVVYGESAGGHLATWLGARHGQKIRAVVALSPVTSISGAISEKNNPEASAKALSLAVRAEEFFGYSIGTTDAHRYMNRVQNAHVVLTTDDWVRPDLHGRKYCAALGDRCVLTEYEGSLHAGDIPAAHPEILRTLRHWADRQIGS